MKNRTLTEQTLSALAFAGDLSMGQPPEHSPVVSCLAARIARHAGAPQQTIEHTAQLALIRWAGCTANAREFADLLGDDIRGRSELLAGRNPFVGADPPEGSIHDAIEPLARAHCEIAAHLCRRLALPDAVETAVSDLFETWDGSGLPAGKSGEDISEEAQYVMLAGDAEVYSRTFGVTRAAVLIDGRAGKTYEASLTRSVARALPGWIAEIDAGAPLEDALQEAALSAEGPVTLDEAARVLGDFADLKIPGKAGEARAAYALAMETAKEAKLSPERRSVVALAASLAPLGGVAISNTRLSGWGDEMSEAMRLIPHWTMRILSRLPDLTDAAELAYLAYERLDGSGLGQGLKASSLPREARIVQAARAAVEAGGELNQNDTRRERTRVYLNEEVTSGRLDGPSVSAVLTAMGLRRRSIPDADRISDLTAREAQVLSELAQGFSNKEIARRLDVSPKTVSTHLEKVFRKLDVQTRAGATLKAIERGLV
ncbi:MAG: HD domain-containing phosphohydrolase [Pseudomonadota bacterium]